MMIKPKRIFIVGHAGAGKALLAQSLAENLGWRFIDANPSLERNFGCELKKILGAEGEKAFHAYEAKIIKHYINEENVVVLLEEGVVDSDENRKLLTTQYVIYLKISIPVQIERIANGRLPVLPFDDLEAFLTKQHLERDHLYDEIAKFSIEPTSVEDDVELIVKFDT